MQFTKITSRSKAKPRICLTYLITRAKCRDYDVERATLWVLRPRSSEHNTYI